MYRSDFIARFFEYFGELGYPLESYLDKDEPMLLRPREHEGTEYLRHFFCFRNKGHKVQLIVDLAKTSDGYTLRVWDLEMLGLLSSGYHFALVDDMDYREFIRQGFFNRLLLYMEDLMGISLSTTERHTLERVSALEKADVDDEAIIKLTKFLDGVL